MTGMVDLTKGVLVNRPTEGYRHLLESSAYGPNPYARNPEDITGQRLGLWKTEDYSAATDEERALWVANLITLRVDLPLRSMLQDLPLDMEEIVGTLSRHTGAEFYMIGIWHGGGQEARFYE